MAKKLSKKDKIKYIAIGVAVIAVIIFYLISVKNGNGNSELAQSLLESVVGEDTAGLINNYAGGNDSGETPPPVVIYDDEEDNSDTLGTDGQDADEGSQQSDADNGNQAGQNEPEATPTQKPTPTPKPTATPVPTSTPVPTQSTYKEYRFRNNNLLTQHYEKHGIEMGFKSKETYEKAASDVINNPDALHKTEKEDGDFVYYVEDTNEFVILSKDGYIRTYFLPSAGLSYYNRQ